MANGSIKAERVSKMAANVLTSMFAAGIMDSAQPSGDPSANATSREHAALALQLVLLPMHIVNTYFTDGGRVLRMLVAFSAVTIMRTWLTLCIFLDQATASGVLLKNEAGLLPLSPALHLAVVGAAADCAEAPPSFGFGWPPTIGCVNSGGGSGGVVAPHVVSVLDSLRSQQSGQVSYASGNDTQKAVAVAAAADVAVVVVGTTSSEGTDRPSTALPAHQLAYLRAVTSVQRRTVVVLMAPGAVAMGDWIDEVGAVLCFFLPGQAQGGAVVALLSGKANPSARLPVTMPRRDNEIGFTSKQ